MLYAEVVIRVASIRSERTGRIVWESDALMASQWMPQIDLIKCTGCGDCIAVCPTDALGWQTGKAALLQPDLCSYCAVCEDVCPVNAIELPYLIMKDEQSGEAKDE